MTPRGGGTTASAAPSRSRSGRGGAGLGWGGAGTLRRVGEGEVREDLPDDRGIVQGGDQAQPAPTMGTREDVNGKRPVHQGRPPAPRRVAARLAERATARSFPAPTRTPRKRSQK